MKTVTKASLRIQMNKEKSTQTDWQLQRDQETQTEQAEQKAGAEEEAGGKKPGEERYIHICEQGQSTKQQK
eukprot:10029289-Karenia_brevis.AAC.1